MAVYAVHELKIEVDTTPGGSATLVEIKDIESISDAYAYTTQEWQPLDTDGYARRKLTGKALDYTFSGKRNIDDAGNDYIAGLINEDALDHNDQKIKITWPNNDTLEITGPIEVTSNVGDASTDISKLEFSIKSDGKPVFTAGV